MHDYEQRKDGDRYPQDDAEYERFPANRLDFFDRQSGTYQEERYDESRFDMAVIAGATVLIPGR